MVYSEQLQVMNLEKINLLEQQQILLGMLTSLDSFCKENRLTYSLGGGSLLGAVRHKGFIPWDDDIDVMMPRKDYDFFLKHFNGKYNNLFCASFGVSNGYFFPYAKLYRLDTVFKEIGVKNSTPVFIDLFPIDGYPDNTLLRPIFILIVSLLKGLLHLKLLNWKKKSGFSIKRFVGKCISSITPAYVLNHLIKYLLSTCSYEKSRYLGAILGRYSNKECYPRSVFDEYFELEFAGYKFMAIKKYDFYLKQHYGNYMKLPPQDERVCSHTEYCAWRKTK